MTLAERLKWVRDKKLGMSEPALAAALGLGSKTTVNRYERGRMPPADYVAGLAELAGVDVSWLLTGQGSPERSAPDEAAWRLQRVREALEAPYDATEADAAPDDLEPPDEGQGERDTA